MTISNGLAGATLNDVHDAASRTTFCPELLATISTIAVASVETLKHVVVFQNDKGGTGKTTVTEWTAAALRFSGRNFVVIDADGGNNSYIRRCGKGSAIVVRWQFDATAVDDFIADRLSGAEVVLIDLGANILASDASVLSFFSALFQRLHHRGAKIWRVGVASCNSPGTTAIMKDLVHEAGTVMTPVIVLNDSDNSSAFEAGLSATKATVVTMPHLSPAVIATRLRRAEPLADILEQPDPRCSMAMALIAKAVHKFGSQEPFAEVIGGAGLARLSELAAGAPKRTMFAVNKPGEASDDAFAANVAAFEAERALDICEEADAWAVLKKWRTAKAAYRKIASS